jgi:hypothetical protein
MRLQICLKLAKVSIFKRLLAVASYVGPVDVTVDLICTVGNFDTSRKNKNLGPCKAKIKNLILVLQSPQFYTHCIFSWGVTFTKFGEKKKIFREKGVEVTCIDRTPS